VPLNRRNIGMVFQSYAIWPHMTVFDNVAYPLRIRRRPASEIAERVKGALKLVEMDAYADRPAPLLSGGQQQRVAIARALATEPELILLDEVTSALDPQLVGEVLDLVTELKGQGATILMTTHEMSFARDVADRIVFLHRGEVVEAGAPADVLDAPRHPALREFLARVSH
jgi:polar amino acid transport system ATP-binding protein